MNFFASLPNEDLCKCIVLPFNSCVTEGLSSAITGVCKLYGTGGNTLVYALFHSAKNVSETVHYEGDASLILAILFTAFLFHVQPVVLSTSMLLQVK